MQFRSFTIISSFFASQTLGQTTTRPTSVSSTLPKPSSTLPKPSSTIPNCKRVKNSPVFNCGKPSDNLQVNDVQIKPNGNFKTGQNVTILMQGQLKEPIREGAKVSYRILYNGIQLDNKQNQDLCQGLRDNKAQFQCPIKAGPFVYRETLQIPANIPTGQYIFESSANQDAIKQIYNLKMESSLSS